MRNRFLIALMACAGTLLPAAALAQEAPAAPATQPGAAPASEPAPSAEPTADPNAPRADMRFRMAVGEAHKYRWHTQTRLDFQRTDKPEENVVRNTDLLFEVTVRMLETTDAGGKASLTFDRILLDEKVGDKPRNFDSSLPQAADEGNVVAPTFRPMVGKTLDLTFDANGRIIDVQGMEDLRDPENIGARGAATIIQLSPIRNRFEAIFGLGKLEQGVAVGTRWSSEERAAMSPTAELAYVRAPHMVSVEGDIVKLEVTIAARMEGVQIPEQGEWNLERYTNTSSAEWNQKLGVLERFVTDEASMFTFQVVRPDGKLIRTSYDNTAIINLERMPDNAAQPAPEAPAKSTLPESAS